MPWQPSHIAIALSTPSFFSVVAGRASSFFGALSAGGLGCAAAIDVPKAIAAPIRT
jgi:hypothetical protein